MTYKSLFARFARSLGEGERAPRSRQLKFQTPGAPTIYLAHVFEDWGLVSQAGGALAVCGVDVYADWLFGRMLDDFDREAEDRLRRRLGRKGSWLAVLVSELTPLGGRISWVLELAQAVMPRSRFALLPVQMGADEWRLQPELERFPRIEEVDGDLCVVGADSRGPVPLSRWLSLSDSSAGGKT